MALSEYSQRLRKRVDALLKSLVARVCELQARAASRRLHACRARGREQRVTPPEED